MDFIKKLREKPKATRKRILYITTFFLTGLIFLFWIWTLPYRLSSGSDVSKKESLRKDFTPLYLLKDNISGAYEEVTEGFNTVKGNLSSEKN